MGRLSVRTSAEKWVMPISRAATTQRTDEDVAHAHAVVLVGDADRHLGHARVRMQPHEARRADVGLLRPLERHPDEVIRVVDIAEQIQELGRGLGRGMEALVARLLGVVAHCLAPAAVLAQATGARDAAPVSQRHLDGLSASRGGSGNRGEALGESGIVAHQPLHRPEVTGEPHDRLEGHDRRIARGTAQTASSPTMEPGPRVPSS